MKFVFALLILLSIFAPKFIQKKLFEGRISVHESIVHTFNGTNRSFEFLTDVHMILGISYILPNKFYNKVYNNFHLFLSTDQGKSFKIIPHFQGNFSADKIVLKNGKILIYAPSNKKIFYLTQNFINLYEYSTKGEMTHFTNNPKMTYFSFENMYNFKDYWISRVVLCRMGKSILCKQIQTKCNGLYWTYIHKNEYLVCLNKNWNLYAYNIKDPSNLLIQLGSFNYVLNHGPLLIAVDSNLTEGYFSVFILENFEKRVCYFDQPLKSNIINNINIIGNTIYLTINSKQESSIYLANITDLKFKKIKSDVYTPINRIGRPSVIANAYFPNIVYANFHIPPKFLYSLNTKISTNYGNDWSALMLRSIKPDGYNYLPYISLILSTQEGSNMFLFTKKPWLLVSLGYLVSKLNNDPTAIYLLISNNFGQTWRASLKGQFYFLSIKNQNILVAVPYVGTKIQYSVDDGLTFQAYKFSNQYIYVKKISKNLNDDKIYIFGYRVSYSYVTIELNFDAFELNGCKSSDYVNRTLLDLLSSNPKSFFGRSVTLVAKNKGSECFDTYKFKRILLGHSHHCTMSDLECSANINFNKNCYKNTNLKSRLCSNASFIILPPLYKKQKENKCENMVKSNTYNDILTKEYTFLCINFEKNFYIVKTEEKVYFYGGAGDNIKTQKMTKINIKNSLTFTDYTVDLENTCVYGVYKYKFIYRGCFEGFNSKIKYTLFYKSVDNEEFITNINYDYYSQNLYYTTKNKIYMHNVHKNFRKLLIQEKYNILDSLKIFHQQDSTGFLVYSYFNKIDKNYIYGIFQEYGIHKTTHKLYFEKILYNQLTNQIFLFSNTTKEIFTVKIGKIIPYKKVNESVTDVTIHYNNGINAILFLIGSKLISQENKHIIDFGFAPKNIAHHSYQFISTRSKCDYMFNLVGQWQQCACPNDLMYSFYTKKCICPLQTEGCSVSACAENEYACKTSGNCIPNSKKCDGVNDCFDLSDENNCNYCGKNQYKCSNFDICIEKNNFCDGYIDCPDGFDEANCETSTCPSGMFDCGDHTCIDQRKVCNGYFDCYNGVDESGCLDLKCEKTGQIMCSLTYQCIPKEKVCDSIFDCWADLTDENYCSLLCEEHCITGNCLTKSDKCNNISDCTYGEDEWGCPFDKNAKNHFTIIALTIATVTVLVFSLMFCIFGTFLVIRRRRTAENALTLQDNQVDTLTNDNIQEFDDDIERVFINN